MDAWDSTYKLYRISNLDQKANRYIGTSESETYFTKITNKPSSNIKIYVEFEEPQNYMTYWYSIFNVDLVRENQFIIL